MTDQDYEAMMERPTHPRKENRANQSTSDLPACTYVVVIPTTDSPVIEALEKLVKALSSPGATGSAPASAELIPLSEYVCVDWSEVHCARSVRNRRCA